ncbi:hypothetical protein A2U01_0108373, partial [Trifolium medium]|nr:hypothetical protein [Trifolium medium]
AKQNHDNGGGMTLQAAINAIKALQEKVDIMEQERENETESKDEELEESQPLSQALWDTKFLPISKFLIYQL